MTVTQAVYDPATQAYVERPFPFDPAPLSKGRRLDDDVAIYLDCTARAGVMPAALSMLFMGDAAEGLYLRRAEKREGWDAFTAEVARRHPEIAARDNAVLARVVATATGDRAGTTRTWRPTTPEACLGAALLDMVPAGVTVTGDAALPGGRLRTGHVRRCDFHLASRHQEERLEVAGLVDRVGRPRTSHGARYIQTTMPARHKAYAALGLPAPVTFCADEVLDRARLMPMLVEVVARVAGMAVSGRR